MLDPSIGSVTSIFQRLRDGDRESARKLWDLYFPRLRGLASKILAGRELPVGPDDAVQAAFFHFVQCVESGRFHNEVHRNDLWKLLGSMTAQMARKQQRAELAQKRNQGRTVRESDLHSPTDAHASLDQLWGIASPPDCDLICEDLLNQLEPELREIAVLKLAGYQNQEVREITGFSLRSIERRLQLIRAIWAEHVEK